jgi:hypothetical protein
MTPPGQPRPWLPALVIALVAALAALWISQNFELVTERGWSGEQGEAAANPFYAARLLLTRMGAQVQQGSVLEGLDDFPTSGTLFLADHEDITPAVAKSLHQWVVEGGRLVVVAQPPAAQVPKGRPQRDPLMHELGVVVTRVGKGYSRGEVEDVTLADGTVVRAALTHGVTLQSIRGAAQWEHRSDNQVLMLEREEGDGDFIVMSSFVPFQNKSIGSHQHAELLWRLAAPEGVAGPVWLVRRLHSLSLPQWLWQHAPAVLGAAALLLLLSLWRVVPRFGPLIPVSRPDRRSLTEHLAAMGRFYASQRRLGKLIDALRQDALDALAARVPEARTADAAARLQAAAQASGIPARDLAPAFAADASTAREFTASVRLLQTFRQRLTRGGEAAAGLGGRAVRRRVKRT